MEVVTYVIIGFAVLVWIAFGVLMSLCINTYESLNWKQKAFAFITGGPAVWIMVLAGLAIWVFEWLGDDDG